MKAHVSVLESPSRSMVSVNGCVRRSPQLASRSNASPMGYEQIAQTKAPGWEEDKMRPMPDFGVSSSKSLVTLGWETLPCRIRAPRKIGATSPTAQNCRQMISFRSRSDSWTFTLEQRAIGIETNFSRCPADFLAASVLRPAQLRVQCLIQPYHKSFKKPPPNQLNIETCVIVKPGKLSILSNTSFRVHSI